MQIIRLFVLNWSGREASDEVRPIKS